MAETSRRARAANIVIIVLIAVSTPILLVGFIYSQTGELPQFGTSRPPELPPPNTLETVVIPATGGEVQTAEPYPAGDYTLVVEGVLPVEDNRLIDSYYLHTDRFGLALDEPELILSPLRVDGERLSELAPAPAYDPFHIYQVAYTLEEARRLVFSLDTEQFVPTEGFVVRVYITQPSSAGS